MHQNLPIAIDVNGAQGLAGYIQAVNALPVLSASEERELAVRYRRDNDLDAARQLVMSQLRHVVTIARGFMGYGLPLADLIQEGNIGLMKAVKRYDPDRDVRLVSFAVHWIKAEIYDYVVRNWRIVKVATTKAQRKLFFNLRKARARLGWMRDDEIETLAHDLDVDASTVREMESRLTSHDVSFDPDPETDDDDRRISPSQYLADEAGDPARLIVAADQERHQHERLSAALDILDDRSRDIITRRWLSEHKPTLMELAAEYSVSAERIRQIEKKALGQMRNAMAA
jgi:RNA polymerase sigma-32 factor